MRVDRPKASILCSETASLGEVRPEIGKERPPAPFDKLFNDRFARGNVTRPA